MSDYPPAIRAAVIILGSLALFAVGVLLINRYEGHPYIWAPYLNSLTLAWPVSIAWIGLVVWVEAGEVPWRDWKWGKK